MPTESEMRSRRDSWPPTLLRLDSSKSSKSSKRETPRALLDDIDEDPLTYFLTPAASGDEDGDDMMGADDMEMDFDAGIEYTGHPREVVRSVSPSSLEGLSKPPPSDRASSPDQDSDITNSDDEEYIRFSPPSGRGTWPWRDLAAESLNYRSRSPVFGLGANALLLSPSYSYSSSPSPSSSYPAPSRGRSNARSRRGTQTRSLSARRRPGHLWREPSPDVWSIEEETEAEMLGEVEAAFAAAVDPTAIAGGKKDGNGLYNQDEAAAKPKKKVRFILPPRELTV
jgi:hypothetical protein